MKSWAKLAYLELQGGGLALLENVRTAIVAYEKVQIGFWFYLYISNFKKSISWPVQGINKHVQRLS